MASKLEDPKSSRCVMGYLKGAHLLICDVMRPQEGFRGSERLKEEIKLFYLRP